MYDITLSTLTQARYDIHCRNEDDLSKNTVATPNTQTKKNVNYRSKSKTYLKHFPYLNWLGLKTVSYNLKLELEKLDKS